MINLRNVSENAMKQMKLEKDNPVTKAEIADNKMLK